MHVARLCIPFQSPAYYRLPNNALFTKTVQTSPEFLPLFVPIEKAFLTFFVFAFISVFTLGRIEGESLDNSAQGNSQVNKHFCDLIPVTGQQTFFILLQK